MNLLDLGDDELIAIFQRVDHKTKLNLMLTCKRFENVIGSYFELFGKFRLAITYKLSQLESLKSPDPDRAQTLTQMRRHFGSVELNRNLILDTENYNLFLQLFTKIGSKVEELRFSGPRVCFVSLINLLKLTPNITKLRMFDVQITPKTMSADQIKLEKLRKIEICSSSSIEIFEKIIKPNSLCEIKISKAVNDSGIFGQVNESYEKFTTSDYRSIPRILSKQGNLTLLELKRISIIDFPESPDWTLDNLQKLVLNRVEYPSPNAFKNFAGFLKTLDKLTDLSVAVWQRETDQLIELFSLPKLTKLKYEFEFHHTGQLERIANWKFQNPGVEELELEWFPPYIEYSHFMKMFPNVRKAKLDFDDSLGPPNLMPLNSWASLVELELTYVHANMLPKIKNLRSLKINKCCDASDSDWNDFCQKNQQLERLEFECSDFIYKHFVFVAEHLPNLKVLITKTIWPKQLDPYRQNNEPFINFEDEDIIKTIGENFAKLEYLELCLMFMKAEDAVAGLKKYLPGLRGVIKEGQNGDMWSQNVTKTVKF